MDHSTLRRRLASSGIVAVALGTRVLALLVLCLLAWAAAPKLIGWIPTTVVSGSMEPRILTGDIIVSMPIEGSDVVPGQVVLADDPSREESLLLHRVVEREADGLRLQGDANRQPDRRLVVDSDVHGLGFLRVPFVGLPVVWMHEGRWDLLALVVAAASAVGFGIVSTRRLLVDPDGARQDGSQSGRRRLGGLAPVAGITVAGVLAIAAVLPTAGAAWSASADTRGSLLTSGGFSCLGQPLGDPDFRLDFSEAEGTEVINTGSGPGTASLSGTAERTVGTCGDSPYVHLDGQAGQVVTMPQLPPQSTFSLEGWFRTTDPQGKILGFGNAQTAASGAHDRHVYVGSDGRLVFGTWDGRGPQVVSTDESVTDGQWHHVLATMSPTEGMTLYLDGDLVGRNPSTTLQSYAGYWRIGFDTITSNWPAAPASAWFSGDLDGIGIHSRVLTADEAHEHAAAGRGGTS